MKEHLKSRPRAAQENLGAATLFAVLMVMCGSAQPQPEVVQISDGRYVWNGDSDYQVDSSGQTWFAYYDSDRYLRLRQPDGKQQVLVSENYGNSPSGLAMADLETGVTLLWRDKLPRKALRLAQSDRPEVLNLDPDSETEALSRLKLQRIANQLHALWLGEKKNPRQPTYNIYYRSLDLASQAPSPIEKLMPGFYPAWAKDDQGGIMAFGWYYYGADRKIVARYRPPGASTFQDEVKIAEAEDIGTTFRGYQVGGRWFVFWVEYNKSASTVDLRGSFSEDQGQSWSKMPINATGFQVGSLSMAADDKGHMVLVVSGREEGWPKGRQEIRITRSADGGKTWTPVSALRPTALEQAYSAYYPMTVLGPEAGQVLVVWQDWREIRSRVYFSFSRDFGETWIYDNVPIGVESNTNLRLTANGDNLYVNKGRYHVLTTQALDDALDGARLLDISFSPDDLAEFARVASASPEEQLIAAATKAEVSGQEAAKFAPKSEDRLRERVNTYWQSIMKDDFKGTYQLFDPFYRAKSEFRDYLKNMGKISYTDYSIQSIDIDGWRAKVETLVKASIPPFQAASTGQTISQEEREIPVSEVWLWMGDDWYRESYDPVEEKRYTHY